MKDTQTLRTQYKVSDFLAWKRDGALNLNPNFQRRPVWKKGAKSYLVDTILRGLPMPIIFLRDLPSDLKSFRPRREVVDGQQRIRTIISFISPDLLEGFELSADSFVISRSHNKEYAGRRFENLPPNAQQRILDYQFSVHSFSSDTDDREILQIFARMNSTGVRLNDQELRNAEFFGYFKQVAYEIATEQLNRWRDWAIFTPDQIARMHEVELTSELMILMIQGVLGKSKSNIELFYKSLDEDFPDAGEVSTRFRDVFDFIAGHFSTEDIIEFFGRRSIFYAVFAAVYGLRYELRDANDFNARVLSTGSAIIKKAKARPIERSMISNILHATKAISYQENVPPMVARALRGATTDTSSRRLLIKFLTSEGNNPCPPLL